MEDLVCSRWEFEKNNPTKFVNIQAMRSPCAPALGAQFSKPPTSSTKSNSLNAMKYFSSPPAEFFVEELRLPPAADDDSGADPGADPVVMSHCGNGPPTTNLPNASESSSQSSNLFWGSVFTSDSPTRNWLIL